MLAKISNKRSWDHFTAVFWTDSESSLKKINKSKELTPFSIREAVSKEYPLLQEIRYMRHQLPTGIRFDWVESHQGNSERKEVQLNEEADVHANKQYGEKGECRSKPKMHFLPHQTVQIFFHGDQYDRDHKT